MILVRPRAWWFNKVPLSVTLLLLLVDGERLSIGTIIVFTAVVLAVCAMGNYGYALNELFDVDEDARLGRNNAAANVPPRRMWAIVALSGTCAELSGIVAGGARAALLTLLELCLPLSYSIPPLRFKERRWLGVAADGLAAHVYPAALALIAVSAWQVRPVSAALAAMVLVWAAAAGLRGILSHQLQTSEQDRAAGLGTVVHDLGNAPLERFIVAGLIPVEVGAFGGAMVLCNGGVVLWAAVALYLIYEAFKTARGVFRITAFRSSGQPYFVEESFYKAWGPIVLALDAARVDPAYLAFVPVYAVLFRPHLIIEFQRLRSTVASLNRATEPCDRSNEEG